MISQFRLKLYLSDHAIYKHYVGDFSYNLPMSSPLRKDLNPSFVIYHKGDKTFWKDYGYDKVYAKDAIGLVSELYGVGRTEAIQIIWQEVVLNKEASITNTVIGERRAKTANIYDYYTHEIKDFELKYWLDNFDVGRDFLKFFGVLGLKSLYRKNDLIWESTPLNPAFVYTYKNSKGFKIYRPKDKKHDKFRGENNGSIIEGWDQLPATADELVIQSSFKDTIVCRRAGYLGCNPTGEGSLSIIKSKARELNQRFKKIFILFDNDKPGISNANRLSKDTGWTPIVMRNFKDPSDSVEKTKNYFEVHSVIGKHLLKKYHI